MIDSVVQFPVICGLGTHTAECLVRRDGVLGSVFFHAHSVQEMGIRTEISKLDQSGD